MNAEDIAVYVKQQVPVFEDVEIVGPGIAYHYTCHADAIGASGGFFGAPLNPDLDRSQDPNETRPASSDPGVVFAYEELAEAASEGASAEHVWKGRISELFEIQFSSAVRAQHSQEKHLLAPPSLLISSREIIGFKRLGRCSELAD